LQSDKLLVAAILGIYINYTSHSQLTGTLNCGCDNVFSIVLGTMWDLAFSYCIRNLHWFISKANTNWDNVTVDLGNLITVAYYCMLVGKIITDYAVLAYCTPLVFFKPQ